jgi:CHAT domain-containing protein
LSARKAQEQSEEACLPVQEHGPERLCFSMSFRSLRKKMKKPEMFPPISPVLVVMPCFYKHNTLENSKAESQRTKRTLCRGKGMKRRPQSIFIALLWVFLFAPLSKTSAFPSAVSGCLPGLAQEKLVFEKGITIKRDIQADEVQAFQMSLAANQYVLVTVKQIRIDIVVTLFTPEGEKLIESDSFRGLAELERLSFTTKTSGNYGVEVRAKSGAPGAFEIHVEEMRAAVAADHTSTEAERLFAQADRLRLKGDAASLRQAIEYYERYVQAAELLKDNASSAIQMIGSCHRMMGNSAKALEYYQQALTVARNFKSSEIEASILNSIGNIYTAQGDSPSALHYYEQAIVILRQLGLRLQESSLLNNLGFLYSSLNETDKALDYLNRAVAIRREMGDLRGEIISLGGLAQVYRDLGDPQSSLTYLNQAKQNLPKLNDSRLEISNLNSLGSVNKEQGNYPEAIQYFERALAILTNFSDPYLEASVLNNLGSVHFALGDARQAFQYFERGLAVARKSQERQREARSLYHIGLTQEVLGDTEKALDFLSQALEIFRAIRDRNGEANALQEIARLENKRGNLLAARAKIEAAIEIIESLREKVSNQDLQTSFFATKKDSYDLYTDILMRLHQADSSQNFDALALQASERARARTLLDMLNEGRIHINQGVDANLEKQRALLQKQINAKEQYRIRLLAGKSTEAQVAAIEKELNELLIQFQEVRAKIRSVNPRYAAIMQPQPATVQEIQQQVLDADTVLLEYALGKQHSYVWLVTRDSIASFELPKRQLIEVAATGVYDLLTARNRSVDNESTEQKLRRVKKEEAEFYSKAAALSQMILAPVAPLLKEKRLLVVTEGVLQYIPFAVLPSPQVSHQKAGKRADSGTSRRSVSASQGFPAADYQPLILHHEIISLPSASVMPVLRRDASRPKTTQKTLAILADPVFSDDDPRLKQSAAKNSPTRQTGSAKAGLAVSAALRSGQDLGIMEFRRLPASRLEAEAIAQLVTMENRLKAVDFEANRANATSPELNQYRIVHFATHTLINSKHPELSGIVLSLVDETGKSQDGFLRLHEIYNLDLAADLVVLSGCQSALGKEIRGEGQVGLTRGFMYAGAARVLASLWKVDDKATADLMKLFYKALLSDKLSPSAAIRAAQIAMIKQKKEPYYWAAFALQGEWK